MLVKILQMIKTVLLVLAMFVVYILPIGNYRFIKYSNRNRYLDSEYSCLLNCEIYTTDEVRNNSILKHFPALISKTSIKYDDLSEFQRKNMKENYKSIEKLITHLGYDKNCFISFEMYEMMISLGYIQPLGLMESTRHYESNEGKLRDGTKNPAYRKTKHIMPKKEIHVMSYVRLRKSNFTETSFRNITTLRKVYTNL